MRTPLGVSLLSLLVGAGDRVDGQCLSFDDLLAIGVSCCPDTACVQLPSSCSAQCAGTIMPMYTNCLPGEEVLPVVDEVLADHVCTASARSPALCFHHKTAASATAASGARSAKQRASLPAAGMMAMASAAVATCATRR